MTFLIVTTQLGDKIQYKCLLHCNDDDDDDTVTDKITIFMIRDDNVK